MFICLGGWKAEELAANDLFILVDVVVSTAEDEDVVKEGDVEAFTTAEKKR